MRITVDYDINHDDAVRTSEEVWLRHQRKPAMRVLAMVCEAIIVLLGVAELAYACATGEVGYGVLGVALVLLGGWGLWSNTERHLQRKLAKQVARVDPVLYSGKRTYEIDELEVQVKWPKKAQMRDIVIRWGDFLCWGEEGRYLWAITDFGHVVLVDTEQISQGEREALEATFAAGIKDRR